MLLGLDVVMVTSPLLEPLSIDTSSLSLVVLFSDPFLPNKVSLNKIKIEIEIRFSYTVLQTSNSIYVKLL